MTNTARNIGIRRFLYGAINDWRNFETEGVRYRVTTVRYFYADVEYRQNQVIPFDAGGGTAYSNLAQLERDWNAQLLENEA
jgi:hypothetical protein